jgi:hypothetical protein
MMTQELLKFTQDSLARMHRASYHHENGETVAGELATVRAAPEYGELPERVRERIAQFAEEMTAPGYESLRGLLSIKQYALELTVSAQADLLNKIADTKRQIIALGGSVD